MSEYSIRRLFSKKTTVKERWIVFTHNVLVPFLTTLLVMIAFENIIDRAVLFFTIFGISLGLVVFSYGLMKFQPLKTEKGRKTFFNRILNVMVSTVFYTLALVVLLSQFFFGQNIPLLGFNPQTQILSIYVQKIYLMIFVWLLSWLTTYLVATWLRNKLAKVNP